MVIISWYTWVCVCLVDQSCPTLWDPMDCRSPGPVAHGIFQARILEWVAISSSRGSSQSRDWTCVSCTAVASLPAEPSGKPDIHTYQDIKGFDPWVRKIPWRKKWQLTVFLSGESHEQRSLEGYSPWGHKSRTQQTRLHMHAHTSIQLKNN